MYIHRDEAIKRIRAALKKKTGKSWSVTGGRGTAWGWITVQAPPKRRVCHEPNPECDQYVYPAPRGISRTIDREPDPGEKGWNTSEPDRRELARAFGLDRDMAHHQGISISPDASEQYVQMVEMADPRAIANLKHERLRCPV